MTLELAALCLAGFALVAHALSAVIMAGLPVLDHVAQRLAPRVRVRWWLALTALPTVLGVLAILVALLPAWGLGHDHCVAHGSHHPHLCSAHASAAPGIVLVVIALIVSVRGLVELYRLCQAARLSQVTSRQLLAASTDRGEAHVFASPRPEAFALGFFRPRVHLSTSLLERHPAIVPAVLAHERAHARHHDGLWRALAPLIGVGHWPTISTQLRARLATAQELAADAEAAAQVPGGAVSVADAIVLLAREAPSVAYGLAFIEGSVPTRVHALLSPPHSSRPWAWSCALAGCALPVLVTIARDSVHHGVETLLGALS